MGVLVIKKFKKEAERFAYYMPKNKLAKKRGLNKKEWLVIYGSNNVATILF